MSFRIIYLKGFLFLNLFVFVSWFIRSFEQTVLIFVEYEKNYVNYVTKVVDGL